MRKIILILSILFFSINSYGQTRVNTSGFSPRANQSFVVEDGNLSARNGLFPPRFTDTTEALTYTPKDTLGNLIYLYSTHSYWYRTIASGSTKKWAEIGSGGSGSGTVQSLTGTADRITITGTPTVNPVVDIASTYVGQSSITTLGTIATGVWNGTAIGSIYGGTGQTTVAIGDLLVGTGVNTWGKLTAGTAAYVLTSNGAGVAPSWQVLPSDNLLFDSLGAAGISPMTTWNNTLYARRISISGGSIDTTASGGLLITITGGGGSGLFPTTGTGTATGNVIGDLDGNTLTVQEGGEDFLVVNAIGESSISSSLAAYINEGDGNTALFEGSVQTTLAQFLFEATFNGGVKSSSISGEANATTSALSYEADTHTFTGAVTFADLAGNGAGFAAIDNNGTISWAAGSGGGGTFVGLTDGPGAFTGQAGKSVRVNVGETALEYFTPSGSGDVTKVGTPVNHEWGVWTGDGTLKGVAVTASRAVVTDANGDPIAATTTATEIGYVNGVTSAIQTQLDSKVFALNVFCGTITGFVDAQELFYFAQVAAPVTTASFYSVVIDRACILIGASITIRCATAGTDESWSMYVRVNDATDYLIETISSTDSRRTWNNNALNTTGISLSPGDELIIKIANPTWATNPATGVSNGYLIFR